MKKVLYTIAVIFMFATSVFAAGNLVNVSGASGVALNGFDPVAFFTVRKPTNGDPSISSTHQGATYYFSSKAHKSMFEANPDKYAPQFGGYCAYGVAVGALFPVDINTWQIRNEKLYLNLNPSVLKLFNKDLDGNIVKAENNWPDLVAENTM